MRNIFDQYTQPENRLTHALVTAMVEDSVLLRKFVRWVMDENPTKRLKIVEQQLPGEYELSEEDYEQTGLPDAWIHDDDEWSLLIENKVAAPLSLNQLKRHQTTARKRGFNKVTVLAIDVTAPRYKLPKNVIFRAWKEVYAWLAQQAKSSEWAGRVLRYMEVAERKWPAEGYLKEGALTEFSGIHFDEDHPYSYSEAKRLIRLMMDELRSHPDLKPMINSKADGRPGITGKRGDSVWDYLRIRGFDKSKPHTQHPHFTLSVREEFISAILIFPSSVEPRFVRTLVDLGEDGFGDVMAEVEKNTRKIVKSASGASPRVSVAQRHFASRRSVATKDGELSFDLRAAVNQEKVQAIKYQPEWLAAVYALISNKKSNMTLSMGVRFPYDKCKRVQSSKILDSIAATWVACKPLLEAMPKR